MKRAHLTLAAGVAVAALLATQQSASAGPAGAAGPAADTWTGTWSASPQSSGDTFDNQTLRQIVHTSISGTSVRIRLSNAFGSGPLTVDDVHVAQRSSGSSVVPSSDHALTFGGQSGTVIAPGASAVSDPLSFSVGAGTDLAVSLHLPTATGPATTHQTGLQDNYVATGDVSGDTDLTGARTTGSYYFLSGVDVVNPAAEGAVVALGASITDGIASGSNSNRRWPDDLASKLNASGRTVGVLNQGISGNQLLRDGAGQSALNRFDRDVLDQPGVRWVIFSDDPINDLTSAAPGSDQLIDGLKQLISRAHARGITFLCSTLTPVEGTNGWNADLETKRAAVNAFIRGADNGCDGVIDQDTATHDPAHPTRYRTDLDSGDHLHPNEKGLQAIADAVDF